MNIPFYKNTTNINGIGQETKKTIYEFKGYNANVTVEEGEFKEMENLSSTNYPCLSQRLPRKEIKSLTSPTALFSKGEKLAYIDGTKFYFDGEEKGEVTEGKKQMVAMLNNIIIFPDKKYYDSAEDKFGDMEISTTISKPVFTATTITSTGAFKDFKVGDAVEVSGCTKYSANNKTVIITDKTDDKLTFASNTFTAGTEDSEEVKIARNVPDLDFICENNNRLWGCKGNNIYGSKLGDPFNFNVFAGLNNDSYAVVVGTDGDFTGCVSFSSHILFFKEDYMHKLFGSKPANYQMQQARCHGLQTDCEKSIQVINETVYYKSRIGIMEYNGGIPENISLNFGNKRYGEAIAGTDGNKYYVSLKSGANWDLFVYDVLRGLWHREDSTHVGEFCYNDGIIYYIDNDTNKLMEMNAPDGTEKIKWSGTLGEITEYSENKKIYSRIKMMIELEANSSIYIDISHDNGEFKNVYYRLSTSRESFAIPIVPQRCDNFRIKVHGAGKCIIKSIVREYMQGSEA